MISDDRLRDLLTSVELGARAEPAFLDELYGRLERERRGHAISVLGRPVSLARMKAFGLATAAIVVVLAVGLFVSFRAPQDHGTIGPGGSPSPSPSAQVRSPLPTASASVSPSTTPAPTPAQPTGTPSPAKAALTALNVMDKAITANFGPVGFNVDDQSLLFMLEDDITAALESGNMSGARQAFDAFAAAVDARTAKLQTPSGDRLLAAMAALSALLPN